MTEQLTEQRTLSWVFNEVRGAKNNPNAIMAGGRANNHGNWYDVVDRVGTYQERTHYPVLGDSSKCVLLFGHQGAPYGSVRGGNLKIQETSKGIEWECQLDARSQAHRDFAIMLERRDASEGSVGMRVRKDTWNSTQTQRDIYGIDLFDVTVTPAGANPMTESSLRSARDADYARILVRGDYELRSGRRLSASTKSALQDMVKAHKDGSKQLHKGLQAHVTALLAGKTLPNPSQGGTLQDGTTSGGGGQNGWNAPDQPSVSTDGAGSRNRRLTPAQRSLLMLQKEKFDDEIRESRIQRDAVLDILREQKAEDRKRWTKRDRLRREALERANQPTDLQRMSDNLKRMNAK